MSYSYGDHYFLFVTIPQLDFIHVRRFRRYFKERQVGEKRRS